MTSWTIRRRIIWADGLPSMDPEDYEVVDQGKAIGRIYQWRSGPRVVWLWSGYGGIGTGQRGNGFGDSLDQAKAAFRKATRLGAAYHEAGHAVVAWSLGVPVGSMAIRDDDPTAGTTDIGSIEHLSTTDRLAVCLAGLEAQGEFGCPTHDHAAFSDYAKVWNIIGEDLTAKQSRDFRDAGSLRARELIRAHTSKAVRVAERLADVGRLDAFEVKGMLDGIEPHKKRDPVRIFVHRGP